MLKQRVREHWEDEPADSRYAVSEEPREYFGEIERRRYQAEPYIRRFAGFPEWRGRRVLKIGVGVGTDFRQWVEDSSWSLEELVQLSQPGSVPMRKQLPPSPGQPVRGGHRLRPGTPITPCVRMADIATARPSSLHVDPQ